MEFFGTKVVRSSLVCVSIRYTVTPRLNNSSFKSTARYLEVLVHESIHTNLSRLPSSGNIA